MRSLVHLDSQFLTDFLSRSTGLKIKVRSEYYKENFVLFDVDKLFNVRLGFLVSVHRSEFIC